MTADSAEIQPGTPPPSVHRSRWVALTVLSLSLLLVGMDVTVLNVAAPALSRLLLPNRVELLWILDIYSLAVAASVLTCGTLSDRIGRKRMMMAGYAVFGLASLAAAFSATPGMLIASRAALGVGAAMVTATSVSVIRVIFTSSRERTLAIALWSASHSAGAAAGPLLGGLLVEHLWWGAVFLVNVPIVAVGLVFGLRVIPESRDPSPRRWDLASVALSVVGVSGVVYSLKYLGGYGADTITTLIGVLGVTLLIVFVHRQRRLDEPLLNLALFTERRFSIPVVCIVIGFGSTPVMLFLLTQRFQLLDGWSPLTAGLALIPWTATSGLGGVLAPWMAARLGHRAVLTLGLLLFAAAMTTIGILAPGTGYAALGLALACAGLGLGVSLPLAGDLLMTATPPERAGEAAAIQQVSFELGGAMGIVALGTVASLTYRALLPAIPGLRPEAAESAQESLGAAQVVSENLGESTGTALMNAAGDAFTTGITNVALIAAVTVTAVAMLSAYLLRPRRSRRPSRTTTNRT